MFFNLNLLSFSCIFCIFFSICMTGQHNDTLMKTTLPNTSTVYNVKKIVQNGIKISGKGESTVWQLANPLSNLSYKWNDGTPPKTVFKALWSDTHFYFLFVVDDGEIITDQTGVDENSKVGLSDRVELFFKNDADLKKPYYCLEMDSDARILTFRSRFYRKYDYEWKWPGTDPLTVKSSLTDTGYIVEGSISMEALKTLQLINNDIIEAGIFRAEYIKTKNGPEPKWISWIPPQSTAPDFHIPSAFGALKLLRGH